MVVALFGDSCTGKSSLAANLAQQLSAEVYSGKDYFKLAKSESMAAALFKKKLCGDKPIIYVIAEKEQLALLPAHCVRVLVTASLETIKERFAQRMGGKLPAPVAAMLERKFGQFEAQPRDLRIDTDQVCVEEAVKQLLTLLEQKGASYENT